MVKKKNLHIYTCNETNTWGNARGSVQIISADIRKDPGMNPGMNE